MWAAYQIVAVCTEIRVQVIYGYEEDIRQIEFLRTRCAQQPQNKRHRRKRQTRSQVVVMSCLAAHIRNRNWIEFVRIDQRLAYRMQNM